MLCESFLLISRCLWLPFPLSLEHEEEESVPGWAPMGKGGEGFASLIPLEQREKATGRRQPGSLEVWRCFVLCFFKVDGIFIWSNRLSSLLHICFYTLVSFLCVEMGPYPVKLCSIVQKQYFQTLTHAVHSLTGELQVLPGTGLTDCMVHWEKKEPFSCSCMAFVQRWSHLPLFKHSDWILWGCLSLHIMLHTSVETASGNSYSFLQKRAETSMKLRLVLSAVTTDAVHGGRVL